MRLYEVGAVAWRSRTYDGSPPFSNLARAALVATYTAGKKIVDESAARAAVTEVIATERTPRRHHQHPTPSGSTGWGAFVHRTFTSNDAISFTANDAQ
jgi:hypothetical protein